MIIIVNVPYQSYKVWTEMDHNLQSVYNVHFDKSDIILTLKIGQGHQTW